MQPEEPDDAQADAIIQRLAELPVAEQPDALRKLADNALAGDVPSAIAYLSLLLDEHDDDDN